MWKIVDNLYLGSKEDSTDRQMLFNAGISYVLSCAKENEFPYQNDFQYLSLNLADPDEQFAARIDNAFSFIDEDVSDGGIFVYCTGGVSRSPAVTLAYLCHKGHSLQTGARIISLATRTRPNKLFATQICRRFDISMSDADQTFLINQMSHISS